MNIQTITYQLCKIESTWIQYDQKKTIVSCSIMIKNIEKKCPEFLFIYWTQDSISDPEIS